MRSPTDFAFTAPLPHYYLWHLVALGVIRADFANPHTGTMDLADPRILSTAWDDIATAYPEATAPARIALIDVGVSRTHPNLAGRIDAARSIDLVTHRHGARSQPDPAATPYDAEKSASFFGGVSLEGLGAIDASPAAKAWLDAVVGDLASATGVVRNLADTDETFGSHGTAIAGLAVGEPVLADGEVEAGIGDILAGEHQIAPGSNLTLLPYFGV